MSSPQFIIKPKKRPASELLASSTMRAQQGSSPVKLHLITVENFGVLKQGTPFRFKRIGGEAAGIYNRFELGTWYSATEFEIAGERISITAYKESHDVWQIVRERVHPLTAISVSIISVILTLSAVRVNEFLRPKINAPNSKQTRAMLFLTENPGFLAIIENVAMHYERTSIPGTSIVDVEVAAKILQDYIDSRKQPSASQ